MRIFLYYNWLDLKQFQMKKWINYLSLYYPLPVKFIIQVNN